ncbi:hydantoin utilization protein A [Paralimibaculum aggregatum]|uniref:Nickel/cobalt efflux system n=1 Tax=Paralimibaculum aggregatum TaxID=3036245 RepID=A0ABQ6LKZ3_9RHOB|nr:hypothetical protein [Limibaculum sp. NKW23]GMG81473.1 hydantoin utilization protein A [Limibaculum sp. NKW23]
MTSFLVLGFVIGMSHALEADHLAAVGAMAARERGGKRAMVMRGMAWGLGHTITLFALCTLVLMFGFALTAERAAALEFGVGAMLVLLGADVLRRMRRRRVHFHVHDHGDGRPHLHAHSHAGSDTDHARDPHHHAHPRGFSLRALGVGLIHGAAGSAALLALAVAATGEPAMALAYVLMFGLGSIAGMGALSFVAAWPLAGIERHTRRIYQALTLGAATVAIVIGGEIMWTTGALAWRAF